MERKTMKALVEKTVALEQEDAGARQPQNPATRVQLLGVGLQLAVPGLLQHVRGASGLTW